MCVFLFVINLPHMISVREAAFFLAFLLTIIALQREGGWQWPPLKYLLLVWTAVGLISLPAGDRPLYSLEMVSKEIIYYIAAFWLFFVMTEDEDDFILLIYAVLASATVWSAVSLYYHFFLDYDYYYAPFDAGKMYRLRSTNMSNFRVVALVFCFAAMRLGRVPRALKLWAAALMPVIILLIYLARQRSGYLVVTGYVLLGAYVFASMALKSTGAKKILLHAALAFAILIPATFWIVNRELAWAPSQNLSIYAEDERWNTWRQALVQISERPILGAGFGNKDFFTPTLRDGGPGRIEDSHNLFLGYGVMAGLPGMLILTALFGGLGFVLLKNLRRFRDRASFGYTASMSGVLILVGFFIEGLTDIVMRHHRGLFFWALMGMVLGSCKAIKGGSRSRDGSGGD